jgi:hypothetical protein
MYTNIPKIEVINIIKTITENNLSTLEQKELIDILRTIPEQNYFEFNQQYYKQTKGLAMGAPTSAVPAEIYIQHIEHKQYRPISLLCTFSKILEKLMYNRLLFFLTRNTILTESQHGFRKSRSTETAIQSFLESVLESIEKKENKIGIFCDLTSGVPSMEAREALLP